MSIIQFSGQHNRDDTTAITLTNKLGEKRTHESLSAATGQVNQRNTRLVSVDHRKLIQTTGF